MAATNAANNPMVSLGGPSGTTAGNIAVMSAQAAADPAAGDVVIANAAGTAEEAGQHAGKDTLLGLCLGRKVLGTAAAANDEIPVALFLPGYEFDANINDDTGNADTTAALTLLNEYHGLNNTNSGGDWVVDTNAAASDSVFILRFGKQIGPLQQHLGNGLVTPTETYLAGSVVNPRVVFVVVASALNPVA